MIAERAHRLGVLLAALGEEPCAHAAGLEQALVASPDRLGLRAGDLAAYDGVGSDDLALLNACAHAAYELRAKQWAALEAVLPMLALVDDVDELLAALPVERLGDVIRPLVVLGWLDRATQ